MVDVRQKATERYHLQLQSEQIVLQDDKKGKEGI